jgi:hypothetical protein
MWPTKELTQRYVAEAGTMANACLEKTEDVIALLQSLGLEGARQAAATTMVSVLKEHHNTVGQFFTKSEVASKHGMEAMGVVFEGQSTVKGLSSEQEKALAKHMKEKQEDGGGKWKGKRLMPYLVPAPSNAAVAQPNPIYQQAGQAWGYSGTTQNQGWPLPATGWQPQQGQSRQIQQQYLQAGGAGRGGGRAINMQRFPCDNCQQYGHWKYMPECPNFHLYLASQQAALEAFKNGSAGAGGDPSAVVPYTGSGIDTR